jgi:prepilin-type N-terminal cleavage/methylation domain-containing protein
MRLPFAEDRTRGFSIIELLVSIAIIGILATIVLASTKKARQNGRDARRRSDLKQLQIAITAYYDTNSAYPSTGGAWYSSETGDAVSNNGGNWIPGLAPKYIDALPRDPLGVTSIPSCSGWKAAYLYRSDDGHGYKILSHCAPEGSWNNTDPMYDPVRPTWAWQVCGGFNLNKASACSY